MAVIPTSATDLRWKDPSFHSGWRGSPPSDLPV